MALYKITVKKQWYAAGQVLEPGMSVQVSSMILADPILINGGQLVRDAFLRVYGVDLQQMRALNGVILESERIGYKRKNRQSFCSETIRKFDFLFVGKIW